jgi:hypothetical protein
MSQTDEGPVPGGGPREGEDATAIKGPNPDAVHPDFLPATPSAPAPPPTAEPAREQEDK